MTASPPAEGGREIRNPKLEIRRKPKIENLNERNKTDKMRLLGLGFGNW